MRWEVKLANVRQRFTGKCASGTSVAGTEKKTEDPFVFEPLFLNFGLD